ncbi:hypothetical protein [Bacillus cereus]
MNKEGIYIIDSKGDSTYFSPPDSGFGEIQIQYCNSVPIRLSDRVAVLLRRIIPIKSKIQLHILKHAVFHQKSFNFLLLINISYDTERTPAFTGCKI